MIAIWNGEIIAHSTDTIRVEGYHYFPPDSVDWNLLLPSTTTSRCWWKGKATYYHVRTKGLVNPDAAWTYENPWPLARRIAGHVAFWRGVSVEPRAGADRHGLAEATVVALTLSCSTCVSTPAASAAVMTLRRSSRGRPMAAVRSDTTAMAAERHMPHG